jgi:hypothetical protein
MEVCRQSKPRLREIRDGQYAACYLYEEGGETS